MPISGAAFSGPVFNAPKYSTGGFRDPTTAWQGTDKVWRMATGCGDHKKGGSCLFKSENFVNWTAVGWLDQPQVPQNPSFWECPDFFEVRTFAKLYIPILLNNIINTPRSIYSFYLPFFALSILSFVHFVFFLKYFLQEVFNLVCFFIFFFSFFVFFVFFVFIFTFFRSLAQAST